MKIMIQFLDMEKADDAFSSKLMEKKIGIKITGKLKYSPLIFAEATMEQIAELVKNPAIKQITFDKEIKVKGNQVTDFEELDENLFVQITDALIMIHAQEAWADGWKGQGIKMAVCDTGIWEAHPWLVGKTVARWTGYGDDAQDRANHGTHVAGICSSVAPEAKLINCKVLNDSGSGSFSTVLSGMEAAKDLGAHVINLSLGAAFPYCPDGDPTDNAIRAIAETVIICCAAGNSGPVSRTIDYPGASKGVVTIGAVDKSNVIAWFSGRGPNYCNPPDVKPDCVAPGVGIVSSIPPDQTAAYNGTSMATPMVTGMMAILKSKKSTFVSRTEIETMLQNSCQTTDKGNVLGYGLINIKTAADYLSPPAPVEPPTPSPDLPSLTSVYTNYTRVRKKIANISSSLTNADIVVFIKQAEGFADAVMKESFKDRFDPTVHGLIREFCEAMAAYDCLTYDISQFASNPQAALTADMLHNIIERDIELLRDPRTVQAMKEMKVRTPDLTTYANFVLARKRIARISTAITDADITEFLMQAESIIDAVMKESFRDNFDSSKHGLIQETCETMAAYAVMNYDISQLASVSQAAETANLLWKLIDRNLELLKDPRIVNAMKAM